MQGSHIAISPVVATSTMIFRRSLEQSSMSWQSRWRRTTTGTRARKRLSPPKSASRPSARDHDSLAGDVGFVDHISQFTFPASPRPPLVPHHLQCLEAIGIHSSSNNSLSSSRRRASLDSRRRRGRRRVGLDSRPRREGLGSRRLVGGCLVVVVDLVSVGQSQGGSLWLGDERWMRDGGKRGLSDRGDLIVPHDGNAVC